MFGIGFWRGDSTFQVGRLALEQVLDLSIAGLGLIGTIAAAWPERKK